MADMQPSETLRRSRDRMARKRAANPEWPWSCVCSDGGDWIQVSVPGFVYKYRCRRCDTVDDRPIRLSL